MPDIKIDDEAMRAVVQKAILESLTAQQRELVVADALKYLVTRTTSERGYRQVTEPSPLERAFQDAVVRVAREVVDQHLADVDVRATVRAAIVEQVDALVADDKGSTDGTGSYSGWLSAAVAEATRDAVKVSLAKGERY